LKGKHASARAIGELKEAREKRGQNLKKMAGIEYDPQQLFYNGAKSGKTLEGRGRC